MQEACFRCTGNALVLILSFLIQIMAQPLLGEGWETRAQAPQECQQHGEGRGCMAWVSLMVETQVLDEGHVHPLLLFK